MENSDGRDSIGGVIRNSNGDWITGFSKNIGTISAFQAVKLLSNDGVSVSHIPLVRAIMHLCSRDWITKFQWILRKANMIADKMAKLTSCQHFRVIHVDILPDELTDLIGLEATAQQEDDFVIT
ncbi:hypothetical protein F3Y22_tig00110610pilonHSYRG00301 [Hibiscus syriacus]|uniref:RNase H type-1 domain-containing protein n=1 Tax=Hibiscus syriacus TaxID=106335 RepID=A0A6A3A1Q7_HIBSY|nr:hypothetical protein F3Y22_tig00110610pilonHSYRG00301 [Hibiscus syriacus]